MFVPVRVKSAYSLGLGTTAVDRLVARASALGLEAMALTDVDNLYGAVLFHRLARQRGIRPLIGVELTASTVVAVSTVVTADAATTTAKLIAARVMRESFGEISLDQVVPAVLVFQN